MSTSRRHSLNSLLFVALTTATMLVNALTPGGDRWKDSYSVGDQCYCDSTFDHGIGEVKVETPAGVLTVREICALIGPGPGSSGHPIYNDIQCGNGPPNDAADETLCPGRVDKGSAGCQILGPTWNLERFLTGDDGNDNSGRNDAAVTGVITDADITNEHSVVTASEPLQQAADCKD